LDPNQISFGQMDPNQITPGQSDPNQTYPYQLDPNQITPGQSDPNQNKPPSGQLCSGCEIPDPHCHFSSPRSDPIPVSPDQQDAKRPQDFPDQQSPKRLRGQDEDDSSSSSDDEN
jgi:hypothetical protein